MPSWLKIAWQAVRVLLPIAKDGIGNAVDERRRPPSPMAEPHQTQDLIDEGLREVEEDKRRD